MEHIYSICSLESELFFDSIYSNKISFRNQDTVEIHRNSFSIDFCRYLPFYNEFLWNMCSRKIAEILGYKSSIYDLLEFSINKKLSNKT